MSGASESDLVISWERFHRDARTLTRELAALGPWARVIAVTRGGMVPACIVARELDLRLVDTVCVSSYEHQDQGALRVLKDIAPGGGNTEGRILIVDDLSDTGTTLAALRALHPKAHFATVYAKPSGESLVDTFVIQVPQDTWIHFPWDLDEDQRGYAPPLAQTLNTD